MPNKRNLISFCVGGIAIFLLAAGAVSFLLWGTGNGGTTSTAVNDKSPMSNLRLSTDVRPIWYNVSIIAYVPGFISFEDPARNQTFEANVTIKIKPNNPTSRIELNARELTFTNLTVTSDVGDTIQVSNVEIQTNLTKVVLILNRQLEAGREYYIWVSYSGLIGDRIFGLYTSSYDTNDGTTKYLATTQMEPTGARLMVPCFDEPSFKAIWRVRIIHPKGTNAISNALEEQQNQPITENGNWLSTQFSETPPMSSYLLAVVVSDFAYKEATMKSTDGKDIRVRVWLRPEIIENSAWALESSMTILAMFERRFEIPFPIPKMDLVGVRDFPAGAMENFGLVIFKERYLPYNSTQDSTQHKALVADIIAHEFAHQWFGDIVTLNWWSNLFLNEGFASFMENTAKNGMYNLSAMENTIDFMEEHEAWGFWSDRLSTAHPLHYDFHGPEELGSIFDGIAYGKGSSILHMIETAIGSEVFYNGIRIYLKRHKFENADYTDLLKALDEAVQASNTNKGMSVKDFAQGWITQPNHPIVIANRIDETRVSLTQTPFILDFEISGDKIRRSWRIPIWYQVNGEDKDLLWLGDQALILENIGKDDLLIINPQSTGFYYVQYDDNLLERINKELTTNITYIPLVARGRVLGDTFWLAHAGYGTYDAAFNLTSYITREKESLPWKFLMDHLNFISSYLDSEPESKIAKEFISLMNDVRIKATSTSLLSAHTRLMAESKVPRIPFDNTRKIDSPYQQRHAMQ
ncbi:peptidase family m1 domain-containing protein [Ditylenchus destructor]|nr:peptidase family m1 domain-containing protein [Ditylenchus destructor]